MELQSARSRWSTIPGEGSIASVLNILKNYRGHSWSVHVATSVSFAGNSATTSNFKEDFAKYPFDSRPAASKRTQRMESA